MLRILTALAVVTPAITLAGDLPVAPEDGKKLQAFTLLPPGSELKDVMLPRYDPALHLTGVLKAEVMKLVNAEQIEGTRVAIRFFNPDNSPRGRIDLDKCLFDQGKGLLTSREPLEIHFGRLTAKGAGLHYAFNQGRGFLLGPATTIIQPLPATTMNTPSASPFRAIAIAGMSLVSQSLTAAPPPPLTEAQLAAIRADAVSRAPAVEAAAAESQADLKTNLAAAETASQAAAAFLVQADIPAVKPDAAPPEPKPLEVVPGPDNTVISCDGGIYFDPEEGVLVYLKNVTVTDPRFNLTGANEVKVFFEKKPVDAKKPDKPEKEKSGSGFGSGVGEKIGDPERIVATGVIKIDQKPADGKEPIQASGAIFIYNVKTDEATLSGGFPWVRQGARIFSSKKSDNLLRIYPKESRFDTPGGGWNMGFPVPQQKQN